MPDFQMQGQWRTTRFPFKLSRQRPCGGPGHPAFLRKSVTYSMHASLRLHAYKSSNTIHCAANMLASRPSHSEGLRAPRPHCGRTIPSPVRLLPILTPACHGTLTIVAPELDLAVIRTRHNQRQRWVECRPVHAPVVALKHVLHHCIAATKQVRVHLKGKSHDSKGQRRVARVRREASVGWRAYIQQLRHIRTLTSPDLQRQNCP